MFVVGGNGFGSRPRRDIGWRWFRWARTNLARSPRNGASWSPGKWRAVRGRWYIETDPAVVGWDHEPNKQPKSDNEQDDKCNRGPAAPNHYALSRVSINVSCHVGRTLSAKISFRDARPNGCARPASARLGRFSWRQFGAVRLVSRRDIEVQGLQGGVTCIDDLVAISALYQDQ